MDEKLHRLYAQNRDPVAFLDESYELHEGKTFYILASALVYPDFIPSTRDVLKTFYDGETMHAFATGLCPKLFGRQPPGFLPIMLHGHLPNGPCLLLVGFRTHFAKNIRHCDAGGVKLRTYGWGKHGTPEPYRNHKVIPILHCLPLPAR